MDWSPSRGDSSSRSDPASMIQVFFGFSKLYNSQKFPRLRNSRHWQSRRQKIQINITGTNSIKPFRKYYTKHLKALSAFLMFAVVFRRLQNRNFEYPRVYFRVLWRLNCIKIHPKRILNFMPTLQTVRKRLSRAADCCWKHLILFALLQKIDFVNVWSCLPLALEGKFLFLVFLLPFPEKLAKLREISLLEIVN